MFTKKGLIFTTICIRDLFFLNWFVQKTVRQPSLSDYKNAYEFDVQKDHI